MRNWFKELFVTRLDRDLEHLRSRCKELFDKVERREKLIDRLAAGYKLTEITYDAAGYRTLVKLWSGREMQEHPFPVYAMSPELPVYLTKELAENKTGILHRVQLAMLYEFGLVCDFNKFKVLDDEFEFIGIKRPSQELYTDTT